MIDFFDKPKNYERVKSTMTNEEKGYSKEETELVANDLPTLYRFAQSIGVDKLSLLRWVDEYPEFCNAYNAIKELQKEFLMDNGLKGLYPPSTFIFVAKNVTDMTDERKVDVTSAGEKLGYVVLPPEQINE